MDNKIKVVCAECQTKVNLIIEKIKIEVVKFRCPGCSTVLCARSPTGKNQEKSPPQQAPKESANPSAPMEGRQQPGREADKGMGHIDPQQDKSSGKQAAPGPGKVQTDEQIKETLQAVDKEAEASGCDLRKFKRFKFNKKVLVDNQIMVEALDICENGLFLHTGRSFEVGATVQVGIQTLPGRFDLVVHATVQHDHKSIGMGLQFVDLNYDQQTKLDDLISSLEEVVGNEIEDRKIILLAGGSDTARNINKSKLVLDGFYVLQAINADQVFEILEHETPDAMLLDWQGTFFQPQEMLDRIRQIAQYDNVIIIVQAALTDAYVEKELLDAGADRCFAKMDTTPAKLSQFLKQLIKEKREKAENPTG